MTVTWDHDAPAWFESVTPARRQFYRPRRDNAFPLWGTVHTAENNPDNIGPDTGAENVRDFITRRPDPGSYHVVGDFDSLVRLGGDMWEMFGTGKPSGGNRWSLHLSMACKAQQWPQIPADRRPWYGINLAIPAADMTRLWDLEPRPISLREAELLVRTRGRQGVRGWCRHADLDPGRRTDPGWSDDEFEGWLAAVGELAGQEDEMTPEEKAELTRQGQVLDAILLRLSGHEGDPPPGKKWFEGWRLLRIEEEVLPRIEQLVKERPAGSLSAEQVRAIVREELAADHRRALGS